MCPSRLLAVLLAAPASSAAPAWGSNCLSCHDVLQPGMLAVFGEDTVADPDETNTGAPDRGPLRVFQTAPNQVTILSADIAGLAPQDTYAVTLTRLRFPRRGKQRNAGLHRRLRVGGMGRRRQLLLRSGHRPPVGGGAGSLLILKSASKLGAAGDYYDMVLAVAGKFGANGTLFYAEEHFYLQVQVSPGDFNNDGTVNAADLAFLLGDWGPCPGCAADLDGDGVVGTGDLAILLGNWGTIELPILHLVQATQLDFAGRNSCCAA